MDNNKSNYRWYVLILAALSAIFSRSLPQLCMPVLFKEISEDLSLSLVEIGTTWGMLLFAGVFISLIGGLLADRFGVKGTMVVFCFLAGLAGGLRGLSVNFLSLVATMWIFGLVSAIVLNTAYKTAGVWFHRDRLGLANGFISGSATVGGVAASLISATLLSPLLGGWRNVVFIYAIFPIVLSLLWLMTGREPEKEKTVTGNDTVIPFRQALAQVVRNKAVWIIGFVMFGQMGSLQGMLGYLPLYLTGMGWEHTSADSTLALHAGLSAIFTIPVMLLSDRLGLRKTLLIPALTIYGVSLGLLSIAEGPIIWMLIIINAIAQSTMLPISFTIAIEAKGVGPIYAGTAVGLVYTCAFLGGFVFPPLGNSLASIDMGLPFVLWGVTSVITLLGFVFLKDSKVV